MSKRALFLVLAACLTVGIASSASAATTWKRLGANPFTSPSLSSEADLKSLVKNRSVDLKTGFTKAGYPDLYPAFMEQFPAARIDSVTVAPGDSFEWVVFKKKATGKVSVLKAATWRGGEAFDAYRFTIDKDGKRHEFVVPYVCGNVALRNITPIPPPPVTVAPPAPAPIAPREPAPAPPAPAPAPVAAPIPAAIAPPPVAVAAPAPPPVVAPPPPAPKPAAAPPAPLPVAASRGGCCSMWALPVSLILQTMCSPAWVTRCPFPTNCTSWVSSGAHSAGWAKTAGARSPPTPCSTTTG